MRARSQCSNHPVDWIWCEHALTVGYRGSLTETFAFFTSILLWTKNRLWVAGNQGQPKDWQEPTDGQTHAVREALRSKRILDAPWQLSQILPKIILAERSEGRINSDFENMTAEAFFKWLRDALAHGDGRTIRPIHKPAARKGKRVIAGFRIEFEAKKGSTEILRLSLYNEDMRRMGEWATSLPINFARHYAAATAISKRQPLALKSEPHEK